MVHGNMVEVTNRHVGAQVGQVDQVDAHELRDGVAREKAGELLRALIAPADDQPRRRLSVDLLSRRKRFGKLHAL